MPYRHNLLFVIIFIILILSLFHLHFFQYFPTSDGLLGSDYAYFFPYLLNGLYWFNTNGYFEIPWFTPAFCGGIPFYPNPQNLYFSIPQVLSIWNGPVQGVYFSVIIFSTIGVVAKTFLLRRVFQLSIPAILVGIVLFLFNGFFISRMLVGHLTYHIFPLVPLLAYGLIYNADEGGRSRQHEIMWIGINALIFVYMIYAGAANFMVPVIYMLVMLWLLAVIFRQSNCKFLVRLILAGLLGMIISSSKLYSSVVFMGLFKRDFYPLPGFDGLFSSIENIFKMLFFTDGQIVVDSIRNFPYVLGEYEVNFQLTPISLLLITTMCILMSYRFFVKREKLAVTLPVKKAAVILIVMLLVPILINTYYPGWSQFLKGLPYIKNSSSLIRWIAIYVPVLCVISAYAVDYIFRSQKYRIAASMICIVLIVLTITSQDWGRYFKHSYNPVNILSAWDADIPPVMSIGSMPGSDKIEIYLERNDLMVRGESQFACYEPVFGYGLEDFPYGNLHLGNVFDELDGTFNINNPACLLYPEENQCMPGDKLTHDEYGIAKSFISYEKIEFEAPVIQKFLQVLSLYTLVLTILAVILSFAFMVFKRNKN